MFWQQIKKSSGYFLGGGLLLGFTTLSLIIGVLTPYFDDDYIRIALAGGFNGAHFNPLAFKAHLIHNFLTWNPRLGDTLSYFYFYGDPKASSFPFLSTFVHIFNGLLLFRLIKGYNIRLNNSLDVLFYSLLQTLYFVGVAVPGQTLFWITGFFNYALPLFFLLLFLNFLPIKNLFSPEKSKIGKHPSLFYRTLKTLCKSLLLLVIGLFAGMGLENLTPLIGLLLGIIGIFALVKKMKKRWGAFFVFLIGLLGYGLGFLALLKGSAGRLVKTHEIPTPWVTHPHLDFFATLKLTLHGLNLYSYGFTLFLLVSLFAVILLPFTKNRLKTSLYLGGLWALVLFPLLLVCTSTVIYKLPTILDYGELSARSFFAPSIIACIGVPLLIWTILPLQKLWATVLTLKSVFLLIFCFALLLPPFLRVYSTEKEIMHFAPFNLTKEPVSNTKRKTFCKKITTMPFYVKNNDPFLPSYLKRFVLIEGLPALNPHWILKPLIKTFECKPFTG